MLPCNLVFLYLVTGALSLCSWTVKDGDDSVILDLSPLANITLYSYLPDIHPGLMYLFEYTPCRNGINYVNEYSETEIMVQETDESPLNINLIIAKWNSTINPQYSNENNIDKWVFRYNKVDDNGFGVAVWQPTFICAPDVQYNMSNVTNQVMQDKSGYYGLFSVTIKTQYACNKSVQSCSWFKEGDDTVMLDLSPLDKVILYSYDYRDVVGNHALYKFEYTPCRNGINYVNGATNIMVQVTDEEMGWNLIVAKWNETVTPHYSSVNDVDQWVFTYVNGYNTDIGLYGWEPTFICAPTVQYNLSNVSILIDNVTCRIYGITIQTKYACAKTVNSHSSFSFAKITFIVVPIICFIGYMCGAVMCYRNNLKCTKNKHGLLERNLQNDDVNPVNITRK
eukprot:301927_1